MRIAVPRKGRALPLEQLAYDRDYLSPDKSQNRIEQEALLAVVRALAGSGVRPVIVADRGFGRAGFLAWLERHRLDYVVVRVKKGACITQADGSRWKLGEEGLRPGELRFVEGVRYGLHHHGRPRELVINVALCWRVAKSRAKEPEEPWYLATTFEDAKRATNWYWQRGWIEQQSFRDAKSRFGLSRVRVGSAERLSRLLMALTIALSWLTLMGLPEGGVLPGGFRAAVSAWGRVSVIGVALSLLEKLENIPPCCLPRTPSDG